MSKLSVMGAFALVSLTGAPGFAEAPLATSELTVITAAMSAGTGLGLDDTQRHLDLFFSSAYGYCDAKKVAHVWRTDVFSAKAVIGSKIANGITDLLDTDIASTARSVSCDWADLGLDYHHAEALAAFWGGSPDQAKATASSMASSVGHRRFMESMGAVIARADSRVTQTNDAHLQLFFTSDYGYCDALKVAHVWGTDVGAAKAIIGSKIANDLTDLVDADIASTSRSVACNWVDTGLDFDDANTLADFWGVSVGEAKSKATAYTSEWGNRGFHERLGSLLTRG